MESVDVVHAPCLERLILWECLSPAGGSRTRLKIGNAPKLSLFGFLEPGKYALEIQDTVITVRIQPSSLLVIFQFLFNLQNVWCNVRTLLLNWVHFSLGLRQLQA
jgi:hypothetical protein